MKAKQIRKHFPNMNKIEVLSKEAFLILNTKCRDWWKLPVPASRGENKRNT